MASKKKRVVEGKLNVPAFSTPGRAGSARLPGLNTRPNTGAASIAKSFEGFSKSLLQIGVAREKNAAASEALDARNAALVGKFKEFDRQASVDIYEATTGDIKGRSAALGLQEQLDAGTIDLLNQNLSLSQTLSSFDQMKDKLLQENFGQQGSGDFTDQRTEQYRSGFIPHIINSVEKQRVRVAAQHKAKFEAERKATVSEYAGMVADSVIQRVAAFDPTAPDSSGTTIEQIGFGVTEFNDVLKQAINLGMKKEEATVHIINTLGLKAVEEGRPELMAFTEQRLPSGGKIANNQVLNKQADEFRVKATTVFIQREKLQITKDARELKNRQRVTSAGAINIMIQNPEADHSEMLKKVSELQILKPATMTSLVSFNRALKENDSDIFMTRGYEAGLYSQIANGDITRVDQLSKLLADGKVTKDVFRRLHTTLQTQLGSDESENAYKIYLRSISESFADPDALILGGANLTDVLNLETIKAKMLTTYREGAIIFQNKFPGASLSSPEAVEFFENHAKQIQIDSPLSKEQIQTPIPEVRRSEDGNTLNPEDLSLFSKTHKQNKINKKAIKEAEDYLIRIRTYLRKR